MLVSRQTLITYVSNPNMKDHSLLSYVPFPPIDHHQRLSNSLHFISGVSLESSFVFEQSHPNQIWIVGESLRCFDVVLIEIVSDLFGRHTTV